MRDIAGLSQVWDALPEARIAGGAVRDRLAGRPVADVDFATPLMPEQVIARLKAAGLKAVPTGLAHGTVTAVARGHAFEVTTLRRDVETDGRHARVEFTDDWQLDASRRDFTINAMSENRAGEVFDYFGGLADLDAGIVRFVGEAKARIEEDYLRILRFFRFFARYGRVAPDPEAVAGIKMLRNGVMRLSAERVWSELKRILEADDPGTAVHLMQELGVLGLLVPGANIAGLDRLIALGPPGDVLLRIAALLDGDVRPFAENWRLSKAEYERLLALRSFKTLTPEADDDALRRALADEPASLWTARSWLAQDGEPGWDGLRARLAAMKRPVFPLQGRDVALLGVPAGPEMGEILRAAQRWWLDGGCVADAQACRVHIAGQLRL